MGGKKHSAVGMERNLAELVSDSEAGNGKSTIINPMSDNENTNI